MAIETPDGWLAWCLPCGYQYLNPHRDVIETDEARHWASESHRLRADGD